MIVTPTRGAIQEAIEARNLLTQDIILHGGTRQGFQVIMGQQTMTHIQELHIKGLTMTLLQELRVKGLNMTLLQELRVKGLNMTQPQDLCNKDQAIMMENQELHVEGHIVALIQELHLKGPSMMILLQGLRKRVTMTPRIELQDKRM